MYKYQFLEDDHPEENMEPKTKKLKPKTQMVVDQKTLEKMRIKYAEIRENRPVPVVLGPSTSAITTEKIPPGTTLSSEEKILEQRHFVPVVSAISPVDEKPISSSLSPEITAQQVESDRSGLIMDRLNSIEAKVDQIKMDVTRKLDALNSNSASLKRMLGAMLDGLNEIKANKSASSGEQIQIEFPIKNDEMLMALEVKSRDAAVERALREQFQKYSKKNIYDFLRTNVENLFKKTARYTWSGRVAVNSSHTDIAKKAADLNVVRILLDAAVETFNASNDICVQQLKRALQNLNAALHMQCRREPESTQN